jgi:hypothetical protein
MGQSVVLVAAVVYGLSAESGMGWAPPSRCNPELTGCFGCQRLNLFDRLLAILDDGVVEPLPCCALARDESL